MLHRNSNGKSGNVDQYDHGKLKDIVLRLL